MRRRRFGRTSLDISEIVLGGGIVGGILILKDEATRLAALKRSVAAGIDWIDTAASYGNGVSETTIGRYLPELSPRPRISTKARVAAEDVGDIAGALTRSLEASLQRLKLPRAGYCGIAPLRCSQGLRINLNCIGRHCRIFCIHQLHYLFDLNFRRHHSCNQWPKYRSCKHTNKHR